MLDAEQARELFDGLVALITNGDDRRLGRVATEVRAVVAEGQPVGKQQKRERVRGVVALTPHEQLAVLADAIEFALVTPVDLALATVKSLTIEGEPLDLIFETDSATESTRLERASAIGAEAGRVDSAPVSAAEVGAATEAIQPLREALDAIRRELAQ